MPDTDRHAFDPPELPRQGGADVDPSVLFAGKKVVMFSLPGAFTPTCSQKHLPGYVAKLPELKAAGVDLVACLSVNDAFVMKAWAEQHEAPPELYARLQAIDANAVQKQEAILQQQRESLATGTDQPNTDEAKKFAAKPSAESVERMKPEAKPADDQAAALRRLLALE